jgi:hypothetical protein
MKNSLVVLLLAVFTQTANVLAAQDWMAICFTAVPADPTAPHRVLRVKEGENTGRRLRLNCGSFCTGWPGDCMEFLCDEYAVGEVCDSIEEITDADGTIVQKEQVGVKEQAMDQYCVEHGLDVDSDECESMQTTLSCLCYDQNADEALPGASPDGSASWP